MIAAVKEILYQLYNMSPLTIFLLYQYVVFDFNLFSTWLHSFVFVALATIQTGNIQNQTEQSNMIFVRLIYLTALQLLIGD